MCFAFLAANREAAYVHALRFAAIAHTVAKACRELGKDGLLRSCSCDEPTVQTGGDTVACSDDVDFGLQFADRVLREGVGSTNRKEDLDIHNFMAGKMVSRNSARLKFSFIISWMFQRDSV